MISDVTTSTRTFPLQITPEEMESYRRFLITLAGIVPTTNPLYLEAAAIIERLEDFAERSVDD